MSKPDIDILYRTLTTRPRGGPYGALMRLIAARPLVSGFVGGAIAIAIALARGHKGASTLPEVAAIICAVVLLVWVGLFWMMREFFASQTEEQVEVVRRIQLSNETLTWSEHNAPLKTISRPTFRMTRATGACESGEGAWPVFILAADSEDAFVLETRVLWEEAKSLAPQDHERDEILPSHVSSPLLELARDALAS